MRQVIFFFLDIRNVDVIHEYSNRTEYQIK